MLHTLPSLEGINISREGLQGPLCIYPFCIQNALENRRKCWKTTFSLCKGSLSAYIFCPSILKNFAWVSNGLWYPSACSFIESFTKSFCIPCKLWVTRYRNENDGCLLLHGSQAHWLSGQPRAHEPKPMVPALSRKHLEIYLPFVKARERISVKWQLGGPWASPSWWLQVGFQEGMTHWWLGDGEKTNLAALQMAARLGLPQLCLLTPGYCLHAAVCMLEGKKLPVFL